MNQYITALENRSTIKDRLLAIANDESEWVQYYNFQAKPVPDEVLSLDPLFVMLAEKYDYKVGILKLDPYTCYDWHTDTRRGVGINMLLNPEVPSVCMFTEIINAPVKPIITHTYRSDTYYIFNTQKPHSVVNGNLPRYLMSVEFDYDKHYLSYEQLIKDLT